MAFMANFTTKGNQLLLRARRVAEVLEAGQAQTPLGERAEQLSHIGQDTLRVVVVPLSQEARLAALCWLLGTEQGFHFCKVTVPPRTGYLELEFQEQGFHLQVGQDRRQFEAMAPFFEALQQAQILGNDPSGLLCDPIRIGLAATNGKFGLRLLLPDDATSLSRNLPLTTHLAREADIVIVAGSADAVVSGELKTCLELLTSGAVAVQPVICGDSGSSTWPKELLGRVKLPPTRLAEEESVDSGAVPFLLGRDDNHIRPLLAEYLKFNDILSLAELLRQRTQEEIEQVQWKLQSSDVATPQRNEETQGRRASDSVVVMLTEELKMLGKSQDNVLRDVQLPEGDLADLITKQRNELQPSDLIQTHEDLVTRFRLSESSLESITSRVEQALASCVTENEKIVNLAVNAAVEHSYTQAGVGSRSLPLPFDASDCLDLARRLLQAPSRYKGEMQRITVGKFLWNTFQSPVMILFVLMMPMSLFIQSPEIGPILRKIRFDTALFALLPLYLATPFFLLNRTRKEHQLQLQRELERAREATESELKATMRTVLDDFKRRMLEYLAQVTETVRRSFEQNAALLGGIHAQATAVRRQSAENRKYAFSNRLASLKPLSQESEAICSETKRLVEEVVSALLAQVKAAGRTST